MIATPGEAEKAAGMAKLNGWGFSKKRGGGNLCSFQSRMVQEQLESSWHPLLLFALTPACKESHPNFADEGTEAQREK